MLLQETRQNMERYKQKREQQTRIFQDKKRRLEEVKREEMEQLYRINETHQFYKKVNAFRNGFVLQAEALTEAF